MNYASIRTCDVANGDGVRVTLFVSGCTHRCPGCFNEAAWDFSYGREFTEETEAELFAALDHPYISGLTILGGEPMEPQNQIGLLPFLMRFRERYGATRTLWLYTGCILEKDLLPGPTPSRWLTNVTAKILSLVDVLVDGPFIKAQKDISLRFRGSANQRIIDLKAFGIDSWTRTA